MNGDGKMLVLHRKKHGINFYTVWFADKPLKKNGIITYREYMGGEAPQGSTRFDTLITDLSETEEEIKKRFSKNCRYYVNRASREDITVEMKSGREIKDSDIDEFLDFFREFWESKGTKLSNYEKLRQELVAYKNKQALAITYAYLNGEKVVYHTHIVNEEIVRLLHSASLYRLQEDDDGKIKNLIGIANRYLHYEEMVYFKSKGKIRYDWGGAGMSEEVVHITEFKKSFGGTPAVFYDYEQTKGIMAVLFKRVVKMIGR